MLSINLHSCIAVIAHHNTSKSSSWVDLSFISNRAVEITIFFEDPELAVKFAEAVNSIKTQKLTIFPACPKPFEYET